MKSFVLNDEMDAQSMTRCLFDFIWIFKIVQSSELLALSITKSLGLLRDIHKNLFLIILPNYLKLNPQYSEKN